MKPVQVDFVDVPLWQLPSPGARRRVAVALAVLLALGGGVLVWRWLDLEQEIAGIDSAIAFARRDLAARTPAAPPPLVLGEQQVKAINQVVGQLNTPWPALFDGVESVATPEIALLQIEPDSRRRLVKGLAEARGHSQMLAYLSLLGGTRPFAGAVVGKHEVNEKDPNRPLRFLFEVALDDRPVPAAVAAPSPKDDE